MTTDSFENALRKNGFTTISDVYSNIEIEQIISCINKAEASNATFRRSAALFAIRQFLKEVPQTIPFIFNEKLKAIIAQLFGANMFVIKSIYFDKPEASNWFVAYHQDLTISVDRKIELPGYGPWTVKQDQFAVQPPLEILQNIYTIRIHLDDTDETNGALKIIAGSHANGICRPETIDRKVEAATCCNVKKGGVMIMRPLLLHSSARSTGNSQRRVIHIEFTDQQLPENVNWSEYLKI